MAFTTIQFVVPDLEPGCPWFSWTRPNVKWCEDNLCAYITAPANTYSNLLYIILGVIMILQARKSNSKTLGLFGPASIITGVSSFAFHASYTYAFQIFDYIGMFCFVNLAIVVNFRRSNTITAHNQHKIYWLLVVGFTILVPLLGYYNIKYQLLVFAQVIYTLYQEIRLNIRSKQRSITPNYSYYLFGLLFLSLGTLCSALDASRIWCDPSNHLYNGHALWHILTAIALFR